MWHGSAQNTGTYIYLIREITSTRIYEAFCFLFPSAGREPYASIAVALQTRF
jgi:hypothetical protein